jgi:hypothetical protein
VRKNIQSGGVGKAQVDVVSSSSLNRQVDIRLDAISQNTEIESTRRVNTCQYRLVLDSEGY